MNQDQKDAFAKALGITPPSQKFLDAGSEHRYDCRCRVCLQWWIEMGPEDPDEPDSYGPFGIEEINRAKGLGDEQENG